MSLSVDGIQHEGKSRIRGYKFMDGTNRIEGVDNISSNNPLTRQDSRQEEEQMLNVSLP